MKTLMRGFGYAFATILLVALSACASPAAGRTSPTTVADLTNTTWSLTSYGDIGYENQVVAGSAVTLKLQSGGQATGSAGCNTFTAQYSISNGTISFSNLNSTDKVCPSGGVMGEEADYLLALQHTGAFELKNDQLTIWYNDGQSVLNFVRLQIP